MQAFIKKNLLLIVTIITGLIFFSFVTPFTPWILLAGIFAMALKPLQNDIFIKRFKFSRALSVYGLLFVMILFLIPFVFSFISIFSNIREQLSHFQGTQSISSVEDIMDKVYGRASFLTNIVPKEKAIKYTVTGIEKTVTQVIGTVSQAVKQLPHALLSLFFFSASLFYFIIDARRMKRFICRLKFIDEQALDRLLSILKTSSQSTVFAAFLTGITQALVIAFPAKLLGFDFFITTFFITFFLSQIPLVGTVPATIFILGYFYVNDNIPALIIMAVVGVLAGLADNVVRVWFLSKYDSLHPLAGFFAALGGLVILGPLGVLIGPVIAMAFFKLLQTELLD